MAAISDGETAKIAHVYIGTYDGQLTADSENRDSQHNDLCKKFPNHVSICLSLQDIRNINFSLLSRCINVGSLELILANNDWR